MSKQSANINLKIFAVYNGHGYNKFMAILK